MLKFYYAQKKMWQLLINIVFIIQILLFIVIFLVTLHWFLDLINLQFLGFVDSLSNFVSGLVKIFYKRMIEIGGVKIDGSILLFDIVALLIIYGGAQLHGFFEKQITKIDIIIDKVARDQEELFNKQLQEDYEKQQLKNSNFAMLISYNLKNVLGNAFWSEQSTDLQDSKEKEVDKQIYYALSKLPGCKVAKSGAQFLLLCPQFERVDDVLNYVLSLLGKIDEFVLKSQMTLTTYVAIEPYDNKADIKKVFTTLNKLISLKMPGEIVCLGSFQLRYEFLKTRKFTTVLKGTYSIDESDKVWSLIKKN